MLGALLIEQVEGISHVVEEIRGMCEAVTLIAAVVISLVRVWNDQMGLSGHFDPVGQFVVEGITVVEKSSCFHEQAPRVRSRPPGHPAHRAHPGQALDNIHSLAYVLALYLFVNMVIVDPAIAVADDLMAALDEGVCHLRVTCQRRRHAENTERNVEPGKDAQHAPDADPRAVLKG